MAGDAEESKSPTQSDSVQERADDVEEAQSAAVVPKELGGGALDVSTAKEEKKSSVLNIEGASNEELKRELLQARQALKEKDQALAKKDGVLIKALARKDEALSQVAAEKEQALSQVVVNEAALAAKDEELAKKEEEVQKLL